MFKKIYNIISLTGYFFLREVRAIRKDSGALLILLGALVIYPLVYSIAYQKELVRELKTIVVDQDKSSSSERLSMFINEAEEIMVVGEVSSMDEAQKLFEEGKASGILFIPKGFEADLFSGRQADVAVYADGSYFMLYRQMISGSMKTIQTFAAGIEVKKMMLQGMPYKQAIKSRDPISADFHFLFNSSGGYGSFIMPGLIIIIIQQTLLIGIGMLGGTEKEKGRFSYLIPKKLSKHEVVPILLGKSLAYLILYLFNCVVTMLWFYNWFDYPDQGNYFHLLMLVIPFLLSTIFLGITLSVLFRKRESSIMFMVFLSLIVMFLSGISWPSYSIPPFLYYLAHIFPTTPMIPAYLRMRIMGVDFSSIKHEYFIMLIQMIVYFITAYLAIFWSSKHRAKEMSVINKE
ncbi:MAG: ABC transporter permease [Syntrophomonas sp.]